MLELNKIHHGDCFEVMKNIPKDSIDTVITDPPYGLSFMNKKWDYDVPNVELRKEVLRVLKPGGTALIFAGSRTQHRMAVNIEDAGFLLKDTIMWLYGSGFPKATDISKQIMKKKGDKGEPTGEIKKHTQKGIAIAEERSAVGGGAFGEAREEMIMKPTDLDAKEWQGWKSHGLKPSYEPIIVAMKPNEGSYSNNALKRGVSGLNIDESRIELKQGEILDVGGRGNHNRGEGYGFKPMGDFEIPEGQGRFPANTIFECACNGLIPIKDKIAKNVSFSNEKQSDGRGTKKAITEDVETTSYIHTNPECPLYILDQQSKGASRFFYCAKASKGEKEKGLDSFTEKPSASSEFRPNHTEKANRGETGNPYGRWKPLKNNHPTVKPLKLMEYLCTLTKTPTGGIVLDPFAGSGTTGVACKNTGRDYILIEREDSYIDIIHGRLSNTTSKKGLFDV